MTTEAVQRDDFSRSANVSTHGELWVRAIALLATVFGAMALILEHGFIRLDRDTGLPVNGAPFPVDALQATCYAAIFGFVVVFWSRFVLAPYRGRFFRDHLVEAAASLAAGVSLVLVLTKAAFLTIGQADALRTGLTIYLVAQLLIEAARFGRRMTITVENPVRAILWGYAVAIVAGAFLLSLPSSNYAERFPDFGNNLTDHLFTATSAVCLVGLTVRDITTYYTPFGQMIILLLIQAGGLAIITLGTLVAKLLGHQTSIQDTAAQMGRTVKVVFFTMLVIEAIGAAFLFPLWDDTATLADRIFMSYFHATSALCNAGFTLQTDSLIRYADRWQTYGIILPLVVVGGLGFPVLANLWHALTGRLQGTLLTLQSKLVLGSTVSLLIVGALCIFVIETPWTNHRWGRDTQYEDTVVKADATVMRNHNPGQRILDACFLSATARTAGFSSVDMSSGKLHPGTRLVLIALMFIGGSPASATGGIKTVTFLVLAAAVVAALRRRQHVQIFGHPIAPETIRRAGVVLLVYATLVWLVTTGLVLAHPQINYLDLVFETTSACGTAGLSTGVTPYLSLAGRILIIVGMYAGRLLPLALLIIMAQSPSDAPGRDSSESLMTG